MSWATKEPATRNIYSNQTPATRTATTNATTTTTTNTTATTATNKTGSGLSNSGFVKTTPTGMNATNGTGTGTGVATSKLNYGAGWTSAVSPRPATTTSGGTMVQDTRETAEVTKRMVKLAVEANQIADETLKELEGQNETIKKQQDEVAVMGDSLNVADRKIKSIRSFFGYLGNQLKKDNSGEHQKERQKWEKEYAKQNFEKEAEKQKNLEVGEEAKIARNKQMLADASVRDADQLKQAKQQSQQQYKAQTKSKAPTTTTENQDVFMGKFMFEENNLPGEQCEAENDLDLVSQHVKSLKTKAETMNDFVLESNKRIDDLHTNLDEVQNRTVAATKRGDKIIKNDSLF